MLQRRHGISTGLAGSVSSRATRSMVCRALAAVVRNDRRIWRPHRAAVSFVPLGQRRLDGAVDIGCALRLALATLPAAEGSASVEPSAAAVRGNCKAAAGGPLPPPCGEYAAYGGLFNTRGVRECLAAHAFGVGLQLSWAPLTDAAPGGHPHTVLFMAGARALACVSFSRVAAAHGHFVWLPAVHVPWAVAARCVESVPKGFGFGQETPETEQLDEFLMPDPPAAGASSSQLHNEWLVESAHVAFHACGSWLRECGRAAGDGGPGDDSDGDDSDDGAGLWQR